MSSFRNETRKGQQLYITYFSVILQKNNPNLLTKPYILTGITFNNMPINCKYYHDQITQT